MTTLAGLKQMEGLCSHWHGRMDAWLGLVQVGERDESSHGGQSPGWEMEPESSSCQHCAELFQDSACPELLWPSVTRPQGWGLQLSPAGLL